MESALTTTPPIRRASAMERAVLPLAVGPAMRIARGRSAMLRRTCGHTFSSRAQRPMAEPMTSATSHGPAPALVATVVADPRSAVLTDALLARLAQGSSSLIERERSPVLLNPGVAADLAITAGVPLAQVRAALEEAVSATGAPVDVIVQPEATRRKRLFLADMDSTMIGQECIDELADFVGLKEKVSAITERAMRGELAFEPALRERVALLAGLDAKVVERILAERITLTPGGATLVRTMKAHGGYAALVS